MWYNAPKLLSVGRLERGGTDYVFDVRDVARLVEQYEQKISPNILS